MHTKLFYCWNNNKHCYGCTCVHLLYILYTCHVNSQVLDLLCKDQGQNMVVSKSATGRGKSGTGTHQNKIHHACTAPHVNLEPPNTALTACRSGGNTFHILES